MNEYPTTTSSAPTAPTAPEPIFKRFSDLSEAGFSIDWGIASFLVISHCLVLVLTPLAYRVCAGWALESDVGLDTAARVDCRHRNDRL